MSVVRSEQFNAEVRGWGQNTRTALLFQIARLNLRQRAALSRIQKAEAKAAGKSPEPPMTTTAVKFKENFGEINVVRFTFPRHGVFVEHGVGRGRPVRSSKARPRPWLSIVIPGQVERLADIVQRLYADRAVGQIRALIPGIVDERVNLK
jgi:hypothetical protein